MIVERSVDIEDEVRIVLSDYITAYCRPLPKNFALPSVLVSQVGGSDTNKVDTFEIVLDARAKTDAEANELLRNAVGILRQAEKEQNTAIGKIYVNSSGSWGSDPVRPELAMCSARLRVVAHFENKTLTKKRGKINGK